MSFISAAFAARGARSIAVLSVIAAMSLAGAGGASAAARVTANPSPHAGVHHHVVADISAFPAGGEGSGTEETCHVYSVLLQRDQSSVNSTTGLANTASQALLENDTYDALDAGCAVID